MATIKVEVTSNRKEYEEALDAVAEKVLTMWGMEAESAAKKLCPVDTGLLRNSITWALAGQGVNSPSYKANDGSASGSYSGQAQADQGGPRHVYVGSNVEYAPYQELGTSRMRAQPFLGPAIEKNQAHFREILEGELKNALQN